MSASLPRTFSPSQTEAYSFCPRYWGFYKARLKPRVITYPEVAAIVGTSVAAGLETFYKARRAGQAITPEVYNTVAVDVSRREQTAALANGARYVAIADREAWDSVERNVLHCLSTHAKVDPFKHYTVETVEETNTDFHDRTDLVLRDRSTGALLVVDFKTKLKLIAEWVKKEQSKWARSWQLHHYAITRGADRFAVALICPRTRQGVYYEVIEVDQRYKQLWIRDAVKLWMEMDLLDGELPTRLRGNTSHSNEYGECAFWRDACSVGLDEAEMTANLVQVERVKP